MRTSHAPRSQRAGGFSLVELMVAAGISGFILAGVLATNLHLAKSGARLANYNEMGGQARRALEQFGNEARLASDLVLNGTGDITLSIPDVNGVVSQVTYAWTVDTLTFFRVSGASSTATTGRRVLVRGIPAPSGGGTGVLFERLDRTGAACITDAATKFLRVSFTLSRATAVTASSSQTATAMFVLRNKAVP